MDFVYSNLADPLCKLRVPVGQRPGCRSPVVEEEGSPVGWVGSPAGGVEAPGVLVAPGRQSFAGRGTGSERS